MKYLIPQYWNAFMTVEGKRDGKAFEALIKRILEMEYGEGTWTPTKESWDGNKDYYWYNSHKKAWAECKNYQKSIDLNVLSPSLVMAQIHHINELLIFSYSRINDNTRKKIIQYAAISKLRVRFYDDDALEQLIILYKDILFPEFFSQADELFIDNYYIAPQICCLVLDNPILAHKLDGSYLQEDFPEEIDLFHIMQLQLVIINRNSINMKCHISIAKKRGWRDVYNFYLIPEELKEGRISVNLSAFETLTYNIILAPVIYKERLTFPALRICYNINREKLETIIPFHSFDCNWISESYLVGENYQNIVKRFDMYGLSRLKFSGIVFYGRSGTGKTRLLNECVLKGLEKDFIVLKFSSLPNNPRKDTEIQTEFGFMIKEIILSLYDIPGEDIIALAEKEVLDGSYAELKENTHIAIQMIREFSKPLSYKQCEQLILKYSDLIYEKLIAKNYLIVIDNVQFFDESVICFLYEIINKGINSNRPCPLSLLMVFNLDYMKRGSSMMDLLMLLKTLDTPFLSESINGFVEEKDAEHFLRQLLFIDQKIEILNLELILKKAKSNPFYIKQLVKWLGDNQILKRQSQGFYITDTIKFADLVRSVPETMNELLKQRWNYFSCTVNIEPFLLALSALHFNESLNEIQIINYELSFDIFKHLSQVGIVRIQNTNCQRKIFYEHDLWESFFVNEYENFAFIFMKWLEDKKQIPEMYDIQFYLFKLYSNKNWTESEMNKWLCEQENIFIPSKLAGEYYNLLFERLFAMYSQYAIKDNWLRYITQVCNQIRDELGSEAALGKLKAVISLLEKKSYLLDSLAYGDFLIYYGEVSDETGAYQEAAKRVSAFVEMIFSNETLFNQQSYKIMLCSMCNRLHVYYRHLATNPISDKRQEKYIRLSINLCHELDFQELNYVNHSDLGYLYYTTLEYKDRAIELWSHACEIYENSNIPMKTLNFYRKKVQLALMQSDFDMALSYCEIGLDYVDNGEYSYQKLLFRWWFNFAMAENYIQHNPLNFDLEILNALTHGEEYELLLNSPKKFCIYELRAIYHYYKRDVLNVLSMGAKAYTALMNGSYRTNRQEIEQQLLYNLSIQLRLLKKTIKIEDLSFIKNSYKKKELFKIITSSENSFKKYLQNHTPNSCIITNDLLFNLPCL